MIPPIFLVFSKIATEHIVCKKAHSHSLDGWQKEIVWARCLRSILQLDMATRTSIGRYAPNAKKRTKYFSFVNRPYAFPLWTNAASESKIVCMPISPE